MLMLMAIDVVVMVADVIQVVLDGGPDGIRGGMGEVVNLMSACGCVILVHSRYLSYYRDNICPIIAYNGTHIVSSFAPIVVPDSSWRIIALYSSQRI